LNIIGLIDKPIWKDIPCVCGEKTIEKYPFKKCLNCKYQECEDSMPQDNFTIKDIDGKNKVIQEIIIHRGSHEDVIGWSFDA
jgi:hypothetical protein